MAQVCRWGTRVELAAGRGALRDRSGAEVARVDRDRVWLRGAPGRELTIEPAPEPHPIFGPCAALRSGADHRSVMGAVSWEAPASIPPVADPGQLPPLTGTMVLNVLASCAVAAQVPRLRYRGPYPTPALFASLCQAFVPMGDEAAFTAEAEALLLAPRMAEAAVDFVPAPFERWWPAPGVGVQARAEIERVFVAGQAFERSPHAIRRLASTPAGALAAELWLGDERWATILELDAGGDLVGGPQPPPVIDDPIVGQELPLALRRALATLLADTVPALVAPLVPQILEEARLRWGDAGYEVLKICEQDLVLHAGLWITLRKHGARRLVLALAEALTPWVCKEAINRSRLEFERI